jgi:hypothetical protein
MGFLLTSNLWRWQDSFVQWRVVFLGYEKFATEPIIAEAEHTADMRNCFIEADIFSVDDPERNW